MGAAIVAGQTSAEVTGGRKLHGERVFAKELRGGAALVLAGLCAEHKTVVENCHFIRRGYERYRKGFQRVGSRHWHRNRNISCWTAENLKKSEEISFRQKKRKKQRQSCRVFLCSGNAGRVAARKSRRTDCQHCDRLSGGDSPRRGVRVSGAECFGRGKRSLHERRDRGDGFDRSAFL